MSDIPPIRGTTRATGPQAARPADNEPVRRTTGPETPQDEDRVEISEMGQLLSTLELDDNIRIDRVMEIREAIRNDTYETPAKLEYTVNRLLEQFRAAPAPRE